jgi:hypothetical protein
MPFEEVLLEPMSLRQISVEQMPLEQVLLEPMSLGQILVEQIPLKQFSVNKCL